VGPRLRGLFLSLAMLTLVVGWVLALGILVSATVGDDFDHLFHLYVYKMLFAFLQASG